MMIMQDQMLKYALDLATRLLLVPAVAALCATCVIRRGAAPLPAGSFPRVAICAHVAAALLALPHILLPNPRKEAAFVVPVVGVFSLSAFKIISFGFGRGALAAAPEAVGTFAKFGAALALPVIPRAAVAGKSSNGATNNGATTAREFWRSAGRRAVAGCAAVAACRVPCLPILILHWLYALVLSLTMGALWDAYCALATAVFGVDAAPSFAAPWLSASFADYWGRRWNLTVSHVLRALVFDPIAEGRLVPLAAAAQEAPNERRPPSPNVAQSPAGEGDSGDDKTAPPPAERGGKQQQQPPQPQLQAARGGGGRGGRLLRRALALHATFAVSGLWHAYIWAHFRTGVVGWRWFLFFACQAPILVAEAALSAARVAIGLPPPPRWLAVFLTNLALIVVAEPLFFGPCDAAGVCGRMLGTSAGATPAPAVA